MRLVMLAILAALAAISLAGDLQAQCANGQCGNSYLAGSSYLSGGSYFSGGCANGQCGQPQTWWPSVVMQPSVVVNPSVYVTPRPAVQPPFASRADGPSYRWVKVPGTRQEALLADGKQIGNWNWQGRYYRALREDGSWGPVVYQTPDGHWAKPPSER